VKIKLVVEVDVNRRDLCYGLNTLEEDLLDNVVKVKSGPYENVIHGYITEVTLPNIGKVQRA